MRKILSFFLAVMLIFSLATQALAATVSLESESNAVTAGEQVVVKLTQSEAVEGITAIKYYVYYDNTLFELTASEPGKNITFGKTGTDSKGFYQVINYLDTTSEGVTIEAGVIATMTFTALEDVTQTQATFTLVNKGVMGVGDEMLENENLVKNGTVSITVSPAPVASYAVTLTEGAGYTIAATEGGSFSFTLSVNSGYEGTPVVMVNGTELTAENGVYTITNITADQTVTVEGIAVKSNMYTVSASADVTTTKGDSAAVSIHVTGNSNAEITGYNDYDMTVSYDPAALTYVSAVAAHSGAEITNDGTAGTVRIIGHGEAKSFADAVVTLNFTADASGNHNVTITSAKIDNSGNAIALDAPEAAVSDRDTVVKVGYPVTLPENFTGEPSVLSGDDYQFTAPSEYYDITVTVNGVEVTPSVDGLVYTISAVNGDVVIKAVGKTYDVTKNGDNATITGEDTSQYGTDYSFTVSANSGYAVTNVSVQIAGTDVDYTLSNGTYVISGSKITGNVTIAATAQQQAENTTQIIFEGVDASEVVGGLIQYAANGEDFTFELNEEEGYVYTAKLGEEELKPTEGVYTIPGTQINGTALTVTISREVYSFSPEVSVKQYIQLDKQVMWLITAAEGETVLAYGEGDTMFWSDNYNAYCWLAVSDTGEDDVLSAAKAAIVPAAADAVAVTIDYDHDVNQTGAVDVNDAQLTYDMYQAKMYSGFDKVTMDKFLEADVTGDGIVNVEDAAAVVAQLLK